MRIRAFITHKQAEQFSDCQDRFCIKEATKSIALADGMSQSYGQKIWAEMLVNTYGERREWMPNPESVKELCPKWNNKIQEHIQSLRDSNAPQYLVIMNENAVSMRKSAGSTFLGIRFDGRHWEGDVLGDSCLIEICDNYIQQIYTSQSSTLFDNHPDYFDSDPTIGGRGTPKPIRGDIDEKTSIILVTDPFSEFLNKKKEQDDETSYVKKMIELHDHEEFEKLVVAWRKEGMHNDDSTLIIVEDDKTDKFNLEIVDDLLDLEKKASTFLKNEAVVFELKGEKEKHVSTMHCKTSSVSDTDFIAQAKVCYNKWQHKNKPKFKTIKKFLELFYDHLYKK